MYLVDRLAASAPYGLRCNLNPTAPDTIPVAAFTDHEFTIALDCPLENGGPFDCTHDSTDNCSLPIYFCDPIDFNNDGLFPDTQDIDDFLAVFAGGPCSTGTCGDIDFNNDGLFPDTLDIDALLSVFSGSPCLR